MKILASRRGRILDGTCFLLVLIVAAGLKVQYSRAGSDDLQWILGPTAAAVQTISGIAFHRETGTGYVNPGRRLIIAPSCAGVNFMIIAFAMSAFCGLAAMEKGRRKAFWIAGTLALAYLTAILVNAVRITAAIHLYEADIYHGALTPEQVHRAGGVGIYFAALYLLHTVLERVLARFRPGTRKAAGIRRQNRGGRIACGRGLAPLFWYLSVTLGIPVIRMAWRDSEPRFLDHLVIVCLVCAAVLVFIRGLRLCFRLAGANMRG